MKEIISLLKKLNLSSTETALYLNGLRFHSVGVAKLVAISKIKRTTAYHALATLVEKGLAAESKQDGRLAYRMTPANELAKLLENRQEQIKSQLAELKVLMPRFPKPEESPEEVPEVINYYGIEGVHAAVDRALYAQSKQWRIMSPKENFFFQSSNEYIEYFKAKRRERGILAKSLWESSVLEKTPTMQDLAERSPRIVPKGLEGKFKSTIIIYDDCMLVISSYGRQFATLIRSKETVQTFSLMFDAIWDSGTTVSV